MLLVEFMAGLVARKFGFLGLLKMYPFRVADTLVLLIFCMVSPFVAAQILSGFAPSRAYLRRAGLHVACCSSR